MSTFGDYKAYKKYEPLYSNWKNQRDIAEAKRAEYLRLNPDKINQEDIQRSKALIRAIDIMDEYSQKRAENMEVATETAVAYGMEAAIFAGAAVGGIIGSLSSIRNIIQKIFKNSKHSKKIATALPIAIGGVAGVISAFPLYSWAAKIEVAASRRG